MKNKKGLIKNKSKFKVKKGSEDLNYDFWSNDT